MRAPTHRRLAAVRIAFVATLIAWPGLSGLIAQGAGSQSPKPQAPAAQATAQKPPAPASTTGTSPTPPSAAAPSTPSTPSAPASSALAAPQPEPYSYQPEGRRDPFLTLIGVGTSDGHVVGRRGDGPSGMTVAEVSVRGTLESRGSLVAMVQGSDNKTYIMHQGDKFLDGSIKAITPQGLIVVQDVHDPLSLVKQREVRKLLKSLEDAKP